MSLLDKLLASNCDVSGTTAEWLSKWPSGCSPNWLGEDIAEDPFFLVFFRDCARQSSGMHSKSDMMYAHG